MAHRTPTSTGLLLVGTLALAAGCSGEDQDTVEEVVDAVTGGPSEDGSPGTGAEESEVEEPVSDTNTDTETEPEALGPPDVVWQNAYEGTLRGRYKIGGNDDLVVTLSSELRDRGFLTAVSPATGAELWRVADVAFTSCFPAVTADGDVVAHLDASTAAGGDDRSHDLALIDGATGAVLDTWEPGNADFEPCVSDALLATDGGVLVYPSRGDQRGFSIADGSIEPLWARRFDRDEPDAMMVAGRPAFREQAALAGERYYLGAIEPHSDGFERGLSVYQFDAATGTTLGRIETPLLSLTGLQVAGPGELLVTGQDKDRRESTAVLVGGTGADDAPNALSIDWSRAFDGDGDGITTTVSALSIATSPGAFASWSGTAAGATVTEFDLATGQANWSASTSSFSNNDSIVALPTGGYAVFPFGGNFLEAYDANGDPAWEIAAVEGVDGAQAMGVYGDNVVMVARRTDGGWGFVGIGPVRPPAAQ